MKRILIFSGLLLLGLSGFLIWRALHPPLTDGEQIAANLDAITAAARARDAATVVSYLAPTFAFNGQPTKRLDFKRQLFGGMTQYRAIDLQINGVKIDVQGETSTSDGRWMLDLSRDPDVPPDSQSGDFKLKWRKIDGEWKIVEVQGAPALNF